MNGFFQSPFFFIFALVFVVTIIYAIREICCWYWKINECVQLLTGIRNSINDMIDLCEILVMNSEKEQKQREKVPAEDNSIIKHPIS